MFYLYYTCIHLFITLLTILFYFSVFNICVFFFSILFCHWFINSIIYLFISHTTVWNSQVSFEVKQGLWFVLLNFVSGNSLGQTRINCWKPVKVFSAVCSCILLKIDSFGSWEPPRRDPAWECFAGSSQSSDQPGRERANPSCSLRDEVDSVWTRVIGQCMQGFGSWKAPCRLMRSCFLSARTHY